MALAMDKTQSQSLLLRMPNEILTQVVETLLQDAADGKYTAYYNRVRWVSVELRQVDYLLIACKTCKRLRQVATPLLYRNVILKDTRPPAWAIKKLDGPESTDPALITLTSFLRTLLERPELRSLVHHLDVRFFLRPMLTMDTDVDVDDYLRPLRQWSINYYQKETHGLRDQDSFNAAVLDHTAPSEGDTSPDDLRERCFAAVLCLIPEVRSVAFQPVPGLDWLAEEWGGSDDWEFGDDDDEEEVEVLNDNDGEYRTLSSLIGGYNDNNILSPRVLRKLESVRFTYDPYYAPVNSSDWEWKTGGKNSLVGNIGNPITPSYTFNISACPNILRCPSVVEFVADAVDSVHKLTDISRSLKRVVLSTSQNPQTALVRASRLWELEELSLYKSDESAFNDDDERPASDLDEDEVGYNEMDVKLWDETLLKMAGTLRVLDIGHAYADYDESETIPHSINIRSLEALEHLSISAMLLNETNMLTTRPLAKILPPRLKSLRIYDWISDLQFVDESTYQSWVEPIVENRIQFEGDAAIGPEDDAVAQFEKKIFLYKTNFSDMLRTFALSCRQTHPDLRSLMVFGFPFDDYGEPHLAFKPRSEVVANTTDVVLGAESIASLFSVAGVSFESYVCQSESELPFRTTQVQKYQ